MERFAHNALKKPGYARYWHGLEMILKGLLPLTSPTKWEGSLAAKALWARAKDRCKA